uniref:4_1_CTD domain-containing protein n=1 Tax=Ascaris lumbricoides TaxID=6252 RepID=A0A0M3HWX5_ASCLU
MRDAGLQNQADAKTVPNSALMLISNTMGDGSKSRHGIALSTNTGTTRREEQNLGKRRTVITAFRSNETAQSSSQSSLEVQQHMNIKTESRLINKQNTAEDYTTKDGQDVESDVAYIDIDQQMEQENGAVLVGRAKQGDEHIDNDEFLRSSVKNEAAIAAVKTRMHDVKDSLIRIEEEASKRIFDGKSGSDENEDNSNRSSIMVRRKYARRAKQISDGNSEGIPANNNANISVNGDQMKAGIVDPNWEMDRKTRGSNIEDHLEERMQRAKRDVEKNILGTAEQHDGMVRTVNDRKYILHQPQLNTPFRLLIPHDAQSDVTAYVAAAIIDTDVSKMHFTETDKRNSKGATARTSEQVNGEAGGQSRSSYGGETLHKVSFMNENRGTENLSDDGATTIDGKWTKTRTAQRTIESNRTTALLRHQTLQDSISSAHHRDTSNHSEHQTESHTQSQKYREFNEASSGKNIISETMEWNYGTENDAPENQTDLNSRVLDTTITGNYDESMTTKNIMKEMNASTIHPTSTEANAKGDNNELSNIVKIEENKVTLEKNKSTLKQRQISESDGSTHEYTSRNDENVIGDTSSGRRSTENYFTDPIHLRRFTESPNDDISLRIDNAIEAANDASTKKMIEIEAVDNIETNRKVSENHSRNKDFQTTAAENWKTGTLASEKSEPAGEENKNSDEGSEETENVMTILVTKSDEQQGTAGKQRNEPSEITSYYAHSASERISEHLKTMELFGGVESHSNEDGTTQAQESSDAKDAEREFVRPTNEVIEDHKHHSTDKLSATEDEKYDNKTTSEAEVGISQRTRGTTEEKTTNAHTKGNVPSSSRSEEKITQIKKHGYTTQVGKDEYGISHETIEGLHDITGAIENDSESLVSVPKVLSPRSTKVLPTEKKQPFITNALSRPVEGSENAFSVMSIAGAETDERHDKVDHSTEISGKHGLFPTATTKKTMTFAQTTVESNDKNEARSTTDMIGQDRTVSPTAESKVTPNVDYLTHEKSDSEVISQHSETTKGTDRLNEGDSTIMVKGLTTAVTFPNTFNYSTENLTSIHAYDVRRSPLPSVIAGDEASNDYYSGKEHHRTSEQTKSAVSPYDRIAEQQNTMTKYDSMHNLETRQTQPRQTIEELGVGSHGETSVDHRSEPLNTTDVMHQSHDSFFDRKTTDKYKTTGNLKAHTMPSEQSFNSENPPTAEVKALSSKDAVENGIVPRSTFLTFDANGTDDKIQKHSTEAVGADSFRDKTEMGANQRDAFSMNSATHSYSASETHRLNDATVASNNGSIKNESNQENDPTMAQGNKTININEVSAISGAKPARTVKSHEDDSTMSNLIGTENGEKIPVFYDTFTSNAADSQHGSTLFPVAEIQDGSQSSPPTNENPPSDQEESQPADFSIFDETGDYKRTEVIAISPMEEARTERSQQNNSSMFDIIGNEDNSERYPWSNDITMSNKEGTQQGNFAAGGETGTDNRNEMQITSAAGIEQTERERTQQVEFIMLDATRTEDSGEKYLSSNDIWVSNQGHSFTTADLAEIEDKDEKHPSADDVATFNGKRTQPSNFTVVGETVMDDKKRTLTISGAGVEQIERTQQDDFAMLDATRTEDDGKRRLSSGNIWISNEESQQHSFTMAVVTETEDKDAKRPSADDVTTSNGEWAPPRNFTAVDEVGMESGNEVLLTLGAETVRTERSQESDFTMHDVTKTEDSGERYFSPNEIPASNGGEQLYRSTMADVKESENGSEKHLSADNAATSNGERTQPGNFTAVDEIARDDRKRTLTTSGGGMEQTGRTQQDEFTMLDAIRTEGSREKYPSSNDFWISKQGHSFTTADVTEIGDKNEKRSSADNVATSKGEWTGPPKFTAVDEVGMESGNEVLLTLDVEDARTERSQQSDFTMHDLTKAEESEGRYFSPNEIPASNRGEQVHNSTMADLKESENGSVKHLTAIGIATSNGERTQLSNTTLVDETVMDDKKRTLTISGAGVEQTERTQQDDFAMLDATRTKDDGKRHLSSGNIWISNEENQQHSFTVAVVTETEDKDAKRPSADDVATSNGEWAPPRNFTAVDEVGMESGNEVLLTLGVEDARTERSQESDFTMHDVTKTEDSGERYFSPNEIPASNGGEQVHSSTMADVKETENGSEKQPFATDNTATNKGNQQGNFSTVDETAIDNRSEILTTSGEDVLRSERSPRDDYTVLDLTRAEDNGKTYSPSHNIIISNGEGSPHNFTVVIVTESEDKFEKYHLTNEIAASEGGSQSHNLSVVAGSETDNTAEVLVTSGAEKVRTDRSQEFDFSMRDATGFGDDSKRTPSLNDILISRGKSTLHRFAAVTVTDDDKSKRQPPASDPATSNGNGTRNPSSDDKASSNGERSQPDNFIDETGNDIRTRQDSTAGHTAASSEGRAENTRNQPNVYFTDDLDYNNIKNEKYSTVGFMLSFNGDGSELDNFTTIGVDMAKESSGEHHAYENKMASSLKRTSTETIHSDNFIRIHTSAIDSDSEIHLETNDSASFSKEGTEGEEIGTDSFANDEENDRSHATDVTVNTNEERTEGEMKLSDNSLMSAITKASDKKDGFLTTRSLVDSSGGRIEIQGYYPKITTMASTASAGDKSEGHASVDLLVTWPEQRTSRLNFLPTNVVAGSNAENLVHSTVDASITANDQWSEDEMSENLGASSMLGIDDKNSVTVPTNKREDHTVTVERFSNGILQKISAGIEGDKPPMRPVTAQIYDSSDSTKEEKNNYGYSVQIGATDVPSGSDAVYGSSENAPSSVPWQGSELNDVVRTEFGESTVSKSLDRLISDSGPLSAQFTATKESTSIPARDKITKSGSQGSIERDTFGDINRSSYGKTSEKTAEISAVSAGGMEGRHTAIEVTTLLRFNDSDSGIIDQQSHHVTQVYKEVSTTPATTTQLTRISNVTSDSATHKEKTEVSTLSASDGTTLGQHTTSERIGDNKTDALQRTFSAKSGVTTTVGQITENNEHIETGELNTSNREYNTYTNDSRVMTDTSGGTTGVSSSKISDAGDDDDNSDQDLMITTLYGGYITKSDPDGATDSVFRRSLEVTQKTFSMRHEGSSFNETTRTTKNVKATQREQYSEEATQETAALKSDSSRVTLISIVSDKNENIFQINNSTNNYAQAGNTTMLDYQNGHTSLHSEALSDGNFPTNNEKQPLVPTKTINYSSRSSNGQPISHWYSDDSHHLQGTKVYANEYSPDNNAASYSNEAYDNVAAKATSFIPKKTMESKETMKQASNNTGVKGLPTASNLTLHSQLVTHTGQSTNSNHAFTTYAFGGITATFRQLSSTLPIATHSEIGTDRAFGDYNISKGGHSNPSVGQRTASKNTPTIASKQTTPGADNMKTTHQVHTATGSNHLTRNNQKDCGDGVQCSQEFNEQFSTSNERSNESDEYDPTKRCQLGGRCNTTNEPSSSSIHESGNIGNDRRSSPTVAATPHQKFSQSDEHSRQGRASYSSSVGIYSTPYHDEIKTSLQINECAHSSDHLTVEVGWPRSSLNGYEITEDDHASLRTSISSEPFNQSSHLSRSTTQYASKTEMSGKPPQHEGPEPDRTKLPPMHPMGYQSITVKPTEYEARYTHAIFDSSSLPYLLLSSAKNTKLERSTRTQVASSAFAKSEPHLTTTVDLISKHGIDTNISSTQSSGMLQTDPADIISATSGFLFAVVLCPPPLVNLSHTNLPSPEDGHLIGYQPIGTIVVHVCANNYIFSSSHQPVSVYVCLDNGQWTDNMRGESCQCR